MFQRCALRHYFVINKANLYSSPQYLMRLSCFEHTPEPSQFIFSDAQQNIIALLTGGYPPYIVFILLIYALLHPLIKLESPAHATHRWVIL